MWNKFFFLFILCMSFAFEASPKDASQCLNSLDEIVKGDAVKEEKLKEFLKLQAGLTLHKLAYALFRNDINKERFTLEGQILNILDKMDEKRKDAEFDRVYQMFKHPKNKLSRHALAEVLPLIEDILNKENEEEDTTKRQLFNLDMSDIKMLSILSEKEKKDNNGAYAQLLSANRDSDKSILNFTKIINSSIRNTHDSVKNIRETMARRLKKLNIMASKLISEILAGTECEVLLQACSKKTDEGMIVLDKGLLSSLEIIADKLSSSDKHKYLRYGDVWLYTKGHSEINKIGKKKKTQGVKKDDVIEYKIKEESDDEVIQNYLVQHILDYMPYFFEQKDLLQKDPELTLALARAIDRGALNKNDPKQRVFFYKGKEYMIPELWNKTYPSRKGGRATKWLEDKAKRLWNYSSLNNDKIIYPDTVSANQKEAFLAKRNEQKILHDHHYTFEFKGRLYRLDGSLVEPSIAGLLSFPTGKSAPVEKLDLTAEEKKKIAREIKDENISYIKNKKVLYVSGVTVDLDQAYSRSKIRYNRANVTVNGRESSSYPSFDGVKAFLKKNPELKEAVVKGIADENRAVVYNGKMVDIIKLKVVPRNQVQDIIIQHRLGQGVVRSKEQLNFQNDYLSSNAAAILNKKETFYNGDHSYHTSTGFTVGQKKKSNSLIKGMTSHKEKHEKIIHLNSLPQKDLIIAFHKDHPARSCQYYTLLDKQKGKLSVLTQDGRIVYEKEALVGSERGDERTLFYDYQKRETNNKTGAGIYHLGSVKKASLSDHYAQFEGNYLTLTGPQDQTIVTGLHQISKTTPERKTLLNNKDSNDNRVTAGGISLAKESMIKYMDKYYEEGCPFYVIPEEKNVAFKVVGDQLVFEQIKNINKKDYFLKEGEKEKAKKIHISMNDARYINDYTSTYMLTLQEKKEQIMQHLDLTNDEYDELTKIAFGILGTETDFAESKLYKFKETKLGQMLVSDVKKYGTAGGGLKFLGTTGLLRFLTYKESNKNSRGPTQIKNAKEFLPKDYNINQADLNRPDNAAIATFFVLANKYQMFKKCESKHSGINDHNRMEYLYYYYMGSPQQVCRGSATVKLNPKADEVRLYAESISILEAP